MTTARGTPRDGLVVSPTQIGAFDADYRLRRVSAVRAATGQTLFPVAVTAGAVQGWAASAVRGVDQTRWVPLLEAFDRYGRPRGAAGALLIHYGGFFSGSAWGYFGVEDQDLFAAGTPALTQGLPNLVRAMVRGLYLRHLTTDYTSYTPGDTVKVAVTVENRGAGAPSPEVHYRVTATGADAPAFETVRAVTLAAHSSAPWRSSVPCRQRQGGCTGSTPSCGSAGRRSTNWRLASWP